MTFPGSLVDPQPVRPTIAKSANDPKQTPRSQRFFIVPPFPLSVVASRDPIHENLSSGKREMVRRPRREYLYSPRQRSLFRGDSSPIMKNNVLTYDAELSCGLQPGISSDSAWKGLVPGGGIEPPRPRGLGILSPVRLPVPPPGRSTERYHKYVREQGNRNTSKLPKGPWGRRVPAFARAPYEIPLSPKLRRGIPPSLENQRAGCDFRAKGEWRRHPDSNRG